MFGISSPPRWLRRRAAMPLSLSLLAFAAFAPSAAHAQIFVDGTRTDNGGGNFLYSFSITNGLSIDLAAFSLNIPVNTPLTNLAAPTGFLAFYEPDPALNGTVPGRVDFLEDADPATPQTFAPGLTVSGFSFQSTSFFTPLSISALDINGTEYTTRPTGPNALVFPGRTALVAAPEPGTLGFLLLAGAPIAVIARRRRHRSAFSPSLKG